MALTSSKGFLCGNLLGISMAPMTELITELALELINNPGPVNCNDDKKPLPTSPIGFPCPKASRTNSCSTIGIDVFMLKPPDTIITASNKTDEVVM
jgi:hypothetical protein